MRQFFSAFLLITFLCVPSAMAQSKSRTWTDKTGKFRIEAKLFSRTDTDIKLKKTDGRVVTVPVASLSTADQKYLKDLADKESENPFAGGEKMEANAAGSASLLDANATNIKTLPGTGRELFINIDEPFTSIVPDPFPAEIKFEPFARPLENLDAYARVSDPILVDPAGPVFAVSTHRVKNTVRQDNFGRLYLVSEAKRNEPVLNIVPTIKLLDHHIESGRSVAVIGVNSPSERAGDIVLLDKLATGKPVAIARWHTLGWDKPGFKPKVEFARLIDSKRAIVCVDYSVYLWDLETGNLSFFIKRVQSPGKLATSGTRKYLAIPTSRGAYLIDVLEGELNGKITFPSSLTPDLHFSPDGKMLAMAAGSQYVVWNLSTVGIEHEGTLANVCGKFYGWVGNENLLTQLAGLVDLKLGMTVWLYSLPSNNQVLTVPGGVIAMDKGQPTSMLSLPLPHEKVAQVKKNLKTISKDMLLLGPGSRVTLKVNATAGVDKQKMLAGLTEAVNRAGWKVAAGSDTVLTADIVRGKKQELHFRPLLGSMFSPHETVKMKPYKASLKIENKGKVIWSRSSSNMVPSLIHLERGQKLKDAVKSFEVADPEFFKRVTIPPKILKPEIGKRLGRSRVSNGQWRD